MQRKRKQHTCMFDWQATQTQPCLFSTLSKGESHFRSLVCIMRNSKYASTSIMCTLRNSKCAFRIKIQNTHFAVVWKLSITLETSKPLCLGVQSHPKHQGDFEVWTRFNRKYISMWQPAGVQLTLPKSNPLGLKKSLWLRENLTYVG